MRAILVSVALGALAATATAQFPPLTLRGDAGSVPGNFNLFVDGGQVGGGGALILSATAGPTPLSLVNRGDPRVLHVGFAPPVVILAGVFLPPNGTLTLPPLAAPNMPSLLGNALYMQAIAAGATQSVGSISQPQPAWMQAAGAFVNRGQQFQNLGGRCTTALVERADQRTMLTGGATGALWAQIATATTEIYDPVTDAFAFGPNMTAPRSVHTATKMTDGRYLITGGVDQNNNPVNTAEIYDPASDSFTAVASMALPRFLHTAHALPGNRVLVIGGMTFNSINQLANMIGSAQNTTEIYDSATNTWAAGPTMTFGRAAHATADLSGGRVLVIGGIGIGLVGGNPAAVFHQLAEIYDPATNTFSPAAPMAEGRGVAAVAALGNDRFLVAGGNAKLDLAMGIIGQVTDTAEIYDATANTWSPGGTMTQGRTMAQAFDIGGGKILVPGGANGDIVFPTAIATSEVYDVATNTWSAGPGLTAARALYAGRINHLGQVHLMGGASGPSASCLDTDDWYYR